MKITRKHLDDAVAHQILDSRQADELYQFLNQQPGIGPSFNFTNVLYYLGGLIAIGAMTVFMTLGWEVFGGWGIFFIALLYAGVALLLARRFQRLGLAIPAGLCATFVVALTPLALYGLQQALGLWPDGSVYRDYHRYIRWHWLYLELGTLAVGIVLAWIYRYPFMMLPLAVTLWYLSMDVAAMLMTSYYDYQFRALVSMYFGLLMTLTAFWVDVRSRSKADYAFWLYIFGVLTFWGGLTAQDSSGELSRFLYFCVNLLMIGIGVVIVRRVFVVFGALGVSFYLGHLAWDVFQDSWYFPIALTVIGLGIIYLGVLWQRHEQKLTERVRSWLPAPLQEMLARS